jgi:hypothetical protein
VVCFRRACFVHRRIPKYLDSRTLSDDATF